MQVLLVLLEEFLEKALICEFSFLSFYLMNSFISELRKLIKRTLFSRKL